VNRIRWLILILGPLPILGSSWAVSAWFRSDPPSMVMRNTVLTGHLGEQTGEPAAVGIRRSQTTSKVLSAECSEAASRLAPMLGGACQVLVRSPFVLAGDLSAVELAALYNETIEPAVRAMSRCYFDAAPSEPITVLLFRGEQSYNRYCESLFGERGISIYGYYKPRQRTLVMNIATGNGTLLHELTHALLDFDFPQAPAWLNEGLASLHEQSRFRTSPHGPWIEGLVNWRLAPLQRVARAEQLRSIAELIEDEDFRGLNEGTNYAQARYFCMFLQQQGLLAEFYKAFRAAQDGDRDGLETLGRMFSGVSLEEVDRRYRQWMLELEPVVESAR